MRHMRKSGVVAVLLCSTVVAVLVGGGAAQADKTVIIQNYYGAAPPPGAAVITQPVGVVPFVYGGYSYLPLRSLTDFLGAALLWDSLKGRALLTFNGRELALAVGSPVAYYGGAPVALPVAPVIIGGYTYVPTVVVTQALGLPVVWEPAHYHVKIKHQDRWGVFTVNPRPAPHVIRQVRLTSAGRPWSPPGQQVARTSPGHSPPSAKPAKGKPEKERAGGKGHQHGHGKHKD